MADDGIFDVVRYAMAGVGGLFALVGLVLLVRAVLAALEVARAQGAWQPVTGRVVDDEVSSGTDRSTTFRPVVTWRGSDGTERTRAVGARGVRSYGRGTDVALLVDPVRPDRVVLAGRAARTQAWLGVVVGLVLVVAGVAFAWVVLAAFGAPTLEL